MRHWFLSFLLWTGIILLAASLHITLRTNTLSWIPWPLFLSLIIPYCMQSPARFLFGLAVIGELSASLPFGFMSAIIFLPLGMARLGKHIEVGMRAKFFLLILVSAALQVGLMVASDWLVVHGWPLVGLGTWQAFIPWQAVGSAAAVSLAAFVIIILYNEWRPKEVWRRPLSGVIIK